MLLAHADGSPAIINFFIPHGGDQHEQLTAWRVHREPWERSAAIGELRRGVEKGAFDPNVVAALTKLVG